jgi:hypothetical protein
VMPMVLACALLIFGELAESRSRGCLRG